MPANDALLLIGHGSARYPDAGAPLHRHAAALRATARFSQVEVALLNGTPSVQDALRRIDAPAIRVIPFFMEDGYFTRIAVPRALARAAVPAHLALHRSAAPRSAPPGSALLCPPVGIHDAIAGLIERRALAACQTLRIPSRTAAIVVAGHGSATAPGRTLALHRHTARVAATELFARVEAACLGETPFIADALHGLRAHPVVVIGCFANQGGHVRDDLPALIAAEQAARTQADPTQADPTQADPTQAGPTVRFAGSVTDEPEMVQIILDQADQTAIPIRIGSDPDAIAHNPGGK